MKVEDIQPETVDRLQNPPVIRLSETSVALPIEDLEGCML